MEETKRRRRTRSSSNSVGSQSTSSSQHITECQADDAPVSEDSSEGSTSSLQNYSAYPVDVLGFNEDGKFVTVSSGRKSPLLLNENKCLSDALQKQLYMNRKEVYEVLRESYTNLILSSENNVSSVCNDSEQKSQSSELARKRSHDNASQKSSSETSSEICEDVTDPVFIPQTKKKKSNDNGNKSPKNEELSSNQNCSPEKSQGSPKEKKKSREGPSTTTTTSSSPASTTTTSSSLASTTTTSSSPKKISKVLQTTQEKVYTDLQNEESLRWDKYCWVCHKKLAASIKELKELMTEEDKRLSSCKSTEEDTNNSGKSCKKIQVLFCRFCVRSFHQSCADIEPENGKDRLWTCNVCKHSYLHDAHSKKLQKSEPILQDLKTLLSCVVDKMSKYKNSSPFHYPVKDEEYPAYKNHIIRPMDLQTLLNNVNNGVYESKSAFVSDVEWIVHNSVIFNKSSSQMTSSARGLYRVCTKELEEASICLDCYIYANRLKSNPFVQVCRIPHILLWAKLKPYPYWPAKLMKIVKDGALVRFFGQHDRATVHLRNCYLLSKDSPNASILDKNLEDYENSVKEIQCHINRLRKEYKEFQYAPFKTLLDVNATKQQRQLLLPRYNMRKALQTRIHYRKRDYQEIMQSGETHEPLLVYWNWKSAKGVKTTKTDSCDSNTPAPSVTEDQKVRLGEGEEGEKHKDQRGVEVRKSTEVEGKEDKRSKEKEDKRSKKKEDNRSKENEDKRSKEKEDKRSKEIEDNRSKEKEDKSKQQKENKNSKEQKDKEEDRKNKEQKKNVDKKSKELSEKEYIKKEVKEEKEKSDAPTETVIGNTTRIIVSSGKKKGDMKEKLEERRKDIVFTGENNVEVDTTHKKGDSVYLVESTTEFENSDIIKNGIQIVETSNNKTTEPNINTSAKNISESKHVFLPKAKQSLIQKLPPIAQRLEKKLSVVECDQQSEAEDKIRRAEYPSVSVEALNKTNADMINESDVCELLIIETDTEEQVVTDTCNTAVATRFKESDVHHSSNDHVNGNKYKLSDSVTENVVFDIEPTTKLSDVFVDESMKKHTGVDNESDIITVQKCQHNIKIEVDANEVVSKNSEDDIDDSSEIITESFEVVNTQESSSRGNLEVTNKNNSVFPECENDTSISHVKKVECNVKPADSIEDSSAEFAKDSCQCGTMLTLDEVTENHNETVIENNEQCGEKQEETAFETREVIAINACDAFDKIHEETPEANKEIAEIETLESLPEVDNKTTENSSESSKIDSETTAGIETVHDSEVRSKDSDDNKAIDDGNENVIETKGSSDDTHSDTLDDNNTENMKQTEAQQLSTEIQNSVNHGSLRCDDRPSVLQTIVGQDIITSIFLEDQNEEKKTENDTNDNDENNIQNTDVETNESNCVEETHSLNDMLPKNFNNVSVQQKRPSVISENKMVSNEEAIIHKNKLTENDLQVISLSESQFNNKNPVTFLDGINTVSDKMSTNSKENVTSTLSALIKTNIDASVLQDTSDQLALNNISDSAQQSILLGKIAGETKEKMIKESGTLKQSSCVAMSENVKTGCDLDVTKNIGDNTNVSSAAESLDSDTDSCKENSIHYTKFNDKSIKCESSFTDTTSISHSIQPYNVRAHDDTAKASEISKLENTSTPLVTENIVKNDLILRSAAEHNAQNEIDNNSASSFDEGTLSVSGIEEDITNANSGISKCCNKRKYSKSYDSTQSSDSMSDDNITDDNPAGLHADTPKKKKKKTRDKSPPDKEKELFPNVLEPQITLSVSPTNSVTLSSTSEQSTIVNKEFFSGASVYLSKEVSLTVINDLNIPNTHIKTDSSTTDSIDSICNMINSSREVTISPVFNESSPTPSSTSSTETRNGNTPRQRRKSATPKRYEYTTVEFSTAEASKIETPSDDDDGDDDDDDDEEEKLLQNNLTKLMEMTESLPFSAFSVAVEQFFTGLTSFSNGRCITRASLEDWEVAKTVYASFKILNDRVNESLPAQIAQVISDYTWECRRNIFSALYLGFFTKTKRKRCVRIGCFRRARLKCCNYGFYCRRDCQKHDWQYHKPLCKNPTVIMDPDGNSPPEARRINQIISGDPKVFIDLSTECTLFSTISQKENNVSVGPENSSLSVAITTVDRQDKTTPATVQIRIKPISTLIDYSIERNLIDPHMYVRPISSASEISPSLFDCSSTSSAESSRVQIVTETTLPLLYPWQSCESITQSASLSHQTGFANTTYLSHYHRSPPRYQTSSSSEYSPIQSTPQSSPDALSSSEDNSIVSYGSHTLQGNHSNSLDFSPPLPHFVMQSNPSSSEDSNLVPYNPEITSENRSVDCGPLVPYNQQVSQRPQLSSLDSSIIPYNSHLSSENQAVSIGQSIVPYVPTNIPSISTSEPISRFSVTQNQNQECEFQLQLHPLFQNTNRFYDLSTRCTPIYPSLTPCPQARTPPCTPCPQTPTPFPQAPTPCPQAPTPCPQAPTPCSPAFTPCPTALTPYPLPLPRTPNSPAYSSVTPANRSMVPVQRNDIINMFSPHNILSPENTVFRQTYTPAPSRRNTNRRGRPPKNRLAQLLDQPSRDHTTPHMTHRSHPHYAPTQWHHQNYNHFNHGLSMPSHHTSMYNNNIFSHNFNRTNFGFHNVQNTVGQRNSATPHLQNWNNQHQQIQNNNMWHNYQRHHSTSSRGSRTPGPSPRPPFPQNHHRNFDNSQH